MFVTGTDSGWFMPAMVGGFAAFALGIACLRRKRWAFRAAAITAAVTLSLDVVASGAVSLTSLVIIVPEVLVLAFAPLALKQLRAIGTASL